MAIKKITEVDTKKVNDFRTKFKMLLEEYNYAAAYISVVFKPDNPSWKMSSDRSWLIDDSLYTDKEYEKLGSDYDDKKELSTENRIKLMDFYNNMLIIQRQMGGWVTSTDGIINGALASITESLGLDTSRIIPIKQDTTYHIFTVNATYQLTYDKNKRFFLKQIDGPEDKKINPEEALALIGCIQPDGELFGNLGVPAISTGDKIMFQFYPFNPIKGITTDAFITPTVLDVVESNNIN